VATSISSVEGKPHVFFANFTGLVGGKNPIPSPQSGVEISVEGNAAKSGFFLPFLGEVTPVGGTVRGGRVVFRLPVIEKGAVFWWEP
jgi:hypothetical protein